MTAKKDIGHVDAALQKLGPFKRYTLVQFFMQILSQFAVATSTLSIVFTGQQNPFRCPVPISSNGSHLDELPYNPYTTNISTANTSQPDYDSLCYTTLHSSDPTAPPSIITCTAQDVEYQLPKNIYFVSEFDLVCDREFFAGLTQTLLTLGLAIGSLFFPYFADNYGRKPILLLCSFLWLGSSLGLAFSVNYTMLAVCKTFTGIFLQGVSQTAVTVMMEILTGKQRGHMFGSLAFIFWTTSIIFMIPVAYVMRDISWRFLELAYCSYFIYIILYLLFMDESLRWLAANGMKERVMYVLKKASRWNGLNFDDVVAAFYKGSETEMSQNEKVPLPPTTDTKLPQTTDTKLPQTTDTKLPQTTDTKLPQTTDTKLPQTIDTKLPQTTDTKLPQTTDTKHPQTTDTKLPQTTDTQLPQTTDTQLPQTTDTKLPTNTFEDNPKANMSSNEDMKTAYCVLEDTGVSDTKLNCWSLFRNKFLRMSTLFSMLSWFFNSLTYYALFLMSSTLSGSLYLNYFLNSVVEIPSAIFLYFFIDRLGRKVCFAAFSIIAGLSLVVAAVLSGWLSDQKIVIKVLTILGKFGISGSFGTIYTMTPELFPTNVRTTGLGLANVCACIGGMLAPFAGLLMNKAVYAPGLIFGISSLILSVWSYFLPETARRQLPQSIKDIEGWSEKRKSGKKRAQVVDVSETKSHINLAFTESNV